MHTWDKTEHAADLVCARMVNFNQDSLNNYASQPLAVRHNKRWLFNAWVQWWELDATPMQKAYSYAIPHEWRTEWGLPPKPCQVRN